MPLDIQQFRSILQRDGARANLFEVTMPFPTSIPAGDASKKLTYLCRTAQLPGSTLGMVSVPYMGRDIKLPGNRTFTEWTLTIINDEDFKIRNTFEVWMDGINSHAKNTRSLSMANYTGYSVDGFVKQLGKSSNVDLRPGGAITSANANRAESIGSSIAIKTYKMIGVWPLDLSPIDVDWATNDTIEEFSVTLAVQWWGSTTTT